jgi:hypothetical protein
MQDCLSEVISTAMAKQILDVLRFVWFSLGNVLDRGRKSIPYNFCTEWVIIKKYHHIHDHNPAIITTFCFQDNTTGKIKVSVLARTASENCSVCFM